jgi:hypothetical protein
VAEDEAVALAVLGVAVGAVLAQADAVAEAMPFDDPGRAGVGGRRSEQRQGEPDERDSCVAFCRWREESDTAVERARQPSSNRFGIGG